MEALSKNGRLSKLTIQNNEKHCQKTINCKRVIVRAGNAPNSELVAEKVKTDTDRRILVDQRCQSSIPGLYAVGDVASRAIGGLRQL
jgi:thioredoxin reductase